MDTALNLTHLNSYYFTNRLHRELVNELAGTGIHQHVFLPVIKRETRAASAVSGVSFSVYRCFSALDRLFWPLKMRRIWTEFKSDIKSHPADVLHAHTLFVNGLIAYRAKKRFGIPYVVTIRNTDVNQFLKRYPKIFGPMGLKIMKEASAILTLSHVYWERNIRDFYGTEVMESLSHKHKTVPNGCEDFWFRNASSHAVAGEPFRLVFVGLLGPNKNLRGVLEACRILIAGGMQVVLKVAGSGPLELELRKTAEGMPVQFLGYVNGREDLLRIYRDSDLLVVPSYTESFGVVYAEAMTQGLPVIFTKGQGFDGFFPDGTVGYAVDPGNPKQIADCICSVRDRYAEIAVHVVENAPAFQWSRAVTRLLEIYREAASRNQVQSKANIL